MAKLNTKYIGLLFISPWLIGFLSFQLYPLVASFAYSFTDYSVLRSAKFVMFDNYIRMFMIDKDFLHSLKVTFSYALMAVPGKLIFALIVALLLNIKIKGMSFYRTLFYLPSILGGSVALSALWRLMFMKDGIVNNMLKGVGIPTPDWLGDPHIALFTISSLEVWQFGSSMVLFLAALKQIPQELYEAAKVDGASWGSGFFKITIPLITPIIFFNLIMQTLHALQAFTSAFVITGGGPLKSTYLVGMKLYNEGFNNFKMGYASAISWVLFAIILLITLLIFKSSDAWVHYNDKEEGAR
ncbi:carbohydrate ABC transporter permease [Paenibacillus hamazuiensis]|uniref:carbohydrate ABC transporter permease n=1 Tax=Paenibacillus hamazuiensis TaxID=2936508 RepID=UPI00200C8954|nr:sugar ABC transporter permease [Paenibacillus hamazuiensis]